MSNERKQVLQLLADGKISADEADRLLEKLTSVRAGEPAAVARSVGTGATPKFMLIHVDCKEGEKVDVRLPIGLLRSGIKLQAMMPKEAAQAMSDNGIDFSQLSGLAGDDLISALHAMTIDVRSAEGDKIQICCE